MENSSTGGPPLDEEGEQLQSTFVPGINDSQNISESGEKKKKGRKMQVSSG